MHKYEYSRCIILKLPINNLLGIHFLLSELSITIIILIRKKGKMETSLQS